MVIEPDFDESISRGEVEIEVVPDDNDADTTDDDEQFMLPPIVLDLNNITVLNASGNYLHLIKSLNILILHKIFKSVITNVTSKLVSIETAYGPNNESFLVQIQRQDLPNDENLVVRLTFISRLSNTLTGFYKTSYKTANNETQ